MRTARTLYFSVLVLAMGVLLGQGSHYLFGQDPEPPSAQRSHSMKLNLNIGGKIVAATLADNATARDFVSVLPLSVSMNDLFGREKYGDLPKPFRKKVPGRTGTKSAISLIGLRLTNSLSTTARTDSRYLRPVSSRSQRSTLVQKHSTCRDR